MKMNFDSNTVRLEYLVLRLSREIINEKTNGGSAGDVCLGGGGCKCGWWSEGELSDLYCGPRRPREYASLFSLHPLETYCPPGVRDRNTEPRPEREHFNYNITNMNRHPGMCSFTCNSNDYFTQILEQLEAKL